VNESAGDPGSSARRRVLLAIEVSQREGGVALALVSDVKDAATCDRVIEVPVGPPDPARDQLMPAIDAAFREAHAEPRDLAGVIVSIGPGGFTGLRMAVATAKALSLGVGCKIVAVPSAVVAASSAQLPAGATLVALASKGDDAWISQVRVDGDGCAILRAELADGAKFEQLVRHAMAEPARGADMSPNAGQNAAPELVLICDEHLPSGVSGVAEALGIRRVALRLSPRACLHEGRRLFERGIFTSADDLVPLYPREPEAVRLWRERQACRTEQARPHGGTGATATA